MTPDQFWESDEWETLLFIGGYQERLNDFRETMAHFVTPMVNVHIQKRSKKIKPADLFSRPKRKQDEVKDTRTEAEIVQERKDIMREWKRFHPPKRSRTHTHHPKP